MIITLIFIAIVIISVLVIRDKFESSKKKLVLNEEKNNDLLNRISLLEEQNKALTKYQGIVDAELKAQQIINEAEVTAKDIVHRSTLQSDQIINEANETKSLAAKELEQVAISMKEIKQQQN